MQWWGWVLLVWAVLATAAGMVLGLVAARLRRRERAGREQLYDEHERR